MSETILILILGVIALGAVAYPLLVGRQRYGDAAELEADIRRYREALAADTVCDRCRHPNPPDARFCAECGRPLDEG
ncbi:MAG: zinc ribbon domain-containing protein [Longimicrobiales bacterium]|nr:zinc ribbon domain-containing protein [Longimicrobiales bacterium]